MKIIGARPVLAAALLLSGLWMPAAFAYTSGHGGGSGGGHASAGHASAGHYGGGAHFAGRAYAPRSFVGSRATYVGASRGAATHWAAAGVGHAAIAQAPGIRGRAIGPGYGHTSRWGGGYWGGRYWPGAYYGPGFAWFLASVPLYCSTFWWNNVPYYYYNDIYYTWSPTPLPARPAAAMTRVLPPPPPRMRSRQAHLLPPAAATTSTPTRPRARTSSSKPWTGPSAISGRHRRRAVRVRRIIGVQPLPVFRDVVTARSSSASRAAGDWAHDPTGGCRPLMVCKYSKGLLTSM
jgi:hypothetical protein